MVTNCTSSFIPSTVWLGTLHVFIEGSFLTYAYDFKIIVYLKVITPFNCFNVPIIFLTKNTEVIFKDLNIVLTKSIKFSNNILSQVLGGN